MSSTLAIRALPAAGGALTALALGVALTRGFNQDALQLTGQLSTASEKLAQLDYRIRHPDIVAEQERQQQLATQVRRFRPLTRLREEPTVSEEVAARFSTYVADGMSSLTHFNAALALDAAYKGVRRWLQDDKHQE